MPIRTLATIALSVFENLMRPASLRVPLRIATALALLLALTALMWAQIGGGSVVGVITDPSGAPLPGATITITHVETNVKNTTTTNMGGYYEFPLLPAGRYQIEAEAGGFSKTRIEPFTLNTGSRPRFDIKLGVKGSGGTDHGRGHGSDV